MFQNPRPASTFRETVGWNLPVSHSSSKLKVPPIGSTASTSSSVSPGRVRFPPPTSNSSSSSLGGLEQTAIPSFQAFVERTPSVDSNPNKPLPATPIPTKRSEGSLTDAYYRRRSTLSSVYSRTPSYASNGQQSPWKIEVPRAESPPLLPPLLQPVAYSRSSPNLTLKKEKEAKEELFGQYEEPRTFAPLVDTPSTVSICTLDSPSRSRAPTMLPAAIMEVVQKKPQTVSLEQAKQAMNAPGAVRMLPEELRAMRKVKSQGRLDSADIFGAGQKAPLPPTRPVWRDSQGRARTVSSESKPTMQNSFHVGTGPVREMKPYAPERPAREDEVDQPRGRTMQRLSGQGPQRNDGGTSNENDFAREYNSLLNQQSRIPSSSPGSASDDSISTHMKMVPQPLFRGKEMPQSRKGSQASGFSVSPFNIHHRGRSVSTQSSGTGFNLRLSVDDGDGRSGDSRNSSTGMIPISPPLDHEDSKRGRLPPPINTAAAQAAGPRPKHRREKSASHFYPHVMRRKSPKDKKASLDNSQPQLPGKPLLATEIIAAQLRTPESTPESSPRANLSLKIAPTSGRKPSEAGSEGSKRRLYQRIIDRGRRGSSQKDSTESTAASPNSPHLFKSTAVYLGWSDTAKRNFDEAKSPSTSTSSRPRFTHIVLPAKPLEEPAKRANIFGNVLESWREGKASRKREELKKLIRVVADESRRSVTFSKDTTLEGKEAGGQPVLARRMSTDGWL